MKRTKLFFTLRIAAILLLLIWPVLLLAGWFEEGASTRGIGVVLPFAAAFFLVLEDVLKGREID